MNKKIGLARYVGIKGTIRKNNQKKFEEAKKNIKKLKNNMHTIEIKYPKYKEAFDYVHNLFPSCDVKEVPIYKTTRRLMEKYGFGHAGGFYCKLFNVIIFTSGSLKKNSSNKYQIRAKLKKDEVIVHELIHYCYSKEGKYSSSVDMNEEFAYGWSLGYLKQKGYSNEDIIKQNYLPYLFNSVNKSVMKNVFMKHGISVNKYNSYTYREKEKIIKKYSKEIYNTAMERSIKKGKEIISIYSKKLKLEEESIPDNKSSKESIGFTFLDLSD